MFGRAVLDHCVMQNCRRAAHVSTLHSTFSSGVYLRWRRSNRPSVAFHFRFSSQFLLKLDSLSVSLLHVLRRGAHVLIDRVLLDVSGSD